jgi:CheY-like chemotaxis protein
MPEVIAFVDDLMSLSRIREAGRAAGVEVRAVRGASELVAAARQARCLVLVDADSQRLPWQDGIAALRAEPATSGLPVIAFVSHVRADHADAARAAGASRVLARSAFVKQLSELMSRAAQPRLEETSP